MKNYLKLSIIAGIIVFVLLLFFVSFTTALIGGLFVFILLSVINNPQLRKWDEEKTKERREKDKRLRNIYEEEQIKIKAKDDYKENKKFREDIGGGRARRRFWGI